MGTPQSPTPPQPSSKQSGSQGAGAAHSASGGAGQAGGNSAHGERVTGFRWWREVVEAIAVALVLAFLIRSFQAEAFVIPTGSMAPTLYGRHKDLVCPKCGYQYQAGASEDTDLTARQPPVVDASCPMCLYTVALDPERLAIHGTFTGDRIIVDKLAYEGEEPARWQVVVFKFPGGAKDNYIKRLIGLPGETIRIFQGDIYVRAPGEQDFRIARKPPRTQWHMLQQVHNTDFVPAELTRARFPARWFADGGSSWQVAEDQRSFTFEGTGPEWLRYRHLLPAMNDWQRLDEGQELDMSRPFLPELITDAYGYNSRRRANEGLGMLMARQRGMHWVGDLGLEADVEVQGNAGAVLLDLVEGGRHFQCRIDVGTGQASLSMINPDGSSHRFDGEGAGVDGEAGGAALEARTGSTELRGPGRHRVRFANADDQVWLWVDGDLITFDGPTTYATSAQTVPHWTPQDAGDLHPVGIGAEGVDGQELRLEVKRLSVLRDVYYIASRAQMQYYGTQVERVFNDYDPSRSSLRRAPSIEEIIEIMGTPESWATTDLFRMRREERFDLERPEDRERHQFFMLGDNSPESSDGRLWPVDQSFVERRLLIGRAIFIYWPHPLYVTAGSTSFPIFPNFPRMGLIH